MSYRYTVESLRLAVSFVERIDLDRKSNGPEQSYHIPISVSTMFSTSH